MENIFNETYAFYGQNASDDPYYAAGTHHPSAATIPSAQQLEHDVDAGLVRPPGLCVVDMLFHADIP